MNKRMYTGVPFAAGLMLGSVLAPVHALAQANPVTIGFIGTLSTPGGYIGEDERDAFQLAINEGGGKLGGIPVKLEVADDALKPANAKQQADRMLRNGVKVFTGITFSNVLAAAVPDVVGAQVFYVSLDAGPSTFAGAQCNPNYFVASYQNDAAHEIAGMAANDTGYKQLVLLAPNYQAGRDALEEFKRTFKGKILAEIYTKLDQTDFSVELARLRSLAPDAIYQFQPGGAGINFAKQYTSAGLAMTIPTLIPTFSMDARMVLATGDAANGIYATAVWTPELANPASEAFVAAFKQAYAISVFHNESHCACHKIALPTEVPA